MQELLDKLHKEAGLNKEEAQKLLDIVAEFITEKYPTLKGQINNLFGTHEEGKGAPQVGGIDISGIG